MGERSLKIPSGPVVWPAQPGDEHVFVTLEPSDRRYHVWVRAPDMIKYGYTTGYSPKFSNSNKRGAIKRARMELDEALQTPHWIAAQGSQHHATKKKSPAQLQREIDATLAKPHDAEAVRKLDAMKRGEVVVTNDKEMDLMTALAGDVMSKVRSLPNPDRVGVKDQYIAWIGPKKPPGYPG